MVVHLDRSPKPFSTPLRLACSALLLVHAAAPAFRADAGPFDGKHFKGRIAYSSDGNYNDEDDWAASPVALAIFAAFGVKDRLVHFDYNSILPRTDPAWEKAHEASVLGAAERYGYKSIFHDCQKDRDGAIGSIRKAINASSADNPLYFIVAGPIDVVFFAIQKSDLRRRKFVYVISHSRWNDGFGTRISFSHNKRSVIALGVQWVQIADQNRFLSTGPFGRPATKEEWRPWQWMKDSGDPKVRFLWDRMRAAARADCSDAGMAYFLMTGDEEPHIAKLKKLLEDHVVPAPLGRRKQVRLEAENFVTLDSYELEDRNDRGASHRINVRLAGAASGRIRTPFAQPYTASAGEYDVAVRYFDEEGSRCRFALHVNGAQQGDHWDAPGAGKTWKTHTIPGVKIKSGDEVMIEVRRHGGECGRLDYVQLDYK